MTKIDIVSGFLGAGKTTFIQKMLKEVLNKEKVVLIENEFGEIGIDGGFLKEAGIEIKEMNSGCICCSLVGDFGASLKEVIKTYSPERILIEPSGVGKLSDVIKAVADLETKENLTDVKLNAAVVVVDVSKCKMYIKNFGEFFINQVESAGTIILSRTQNVSEEKLNEAIALLREHNAKATIITTPWDQLSGEQILKTYESGKSLEEELLEEMKKEMAHKHGDECDDPDCECHHHHDHDHDHEHHHHHHADEVFASWGMETPRKFSEAELREILGELGDAVQYGIVLRAKGIVDAKDGQWLYFDYVPGEMEIRRGAAAVTGRFCVIGSHIREDALKELFAGE